ncbi:type III secretion system export apparatus subunit SctR [Corallococcus sp. M34]|uniref:type III secretion system export apparatus subunit SctR n=1 Tax=Citreicoccus inhibens TaxID=2849499 RepID=UPI001C22DDD2|nr:type III secretion system export apparatus subunit SctR [Citreicoccus inhibens]
MGRLLTGLALLLPTASFGAGASLSQMSYAGNPVAMMGLLALMSLLPFAVLMLTSFSKIAVVLSLARSAMGTQQAPPTLVLTGLAAVLTGHIMAPVAERMYDVGRAAYRDVDSGTEVLDTAARVTEPLRAFLLKHGSAEERARFADLARELRPPEEASHVKEEDAFVIIPAFVITELKEAFEIGFIVFLPFLVLDMVIANVLLALGMQTLSPSQVSLPFKILLFVAVDGWALLSRGLILGYR